MPHRPGVRTASLLALVLVPSIGACKSDKYKGPESEVKKADIKVSLPDIPKFDLPPAPDDKSHTVKELRVKGKKFLDTVVTVKGVVTWAYDCPTAIRQPGMQDKDVQKKIDDDPTLCERPKFYLGDAADTPPEKSLWVVDVPRAFNKLEKLNLPHSETAHPPAVPPYKLGDVITVTGKWALSSNHGENNSEGLLVYQTLHNETQNWDTPPAVPGAPGAGGGPPPPPGAGGPPPPAHH